MKSLEIILNGNPDSALGNISRSVMAFAIPMALGLGGAVVQNLTEPELGIVPPLLTMLVPTAIGILEMFRQFRVTDKKNEEIDRRSEALIIEAFKDFTNVDSGNIHLYRRKKN